MQDIIPSEIHFSTSEVATNSLIIYIRYLELDIMKKKEKKNVLFY